MTQWCTPLTIQSEQLSEVRSRPGRTPPLEHHHKRLPNRLELSHLWGASIPNLRGGAICRVGAKNTVESKRT